MNSAQKIFIGKWLEDFSKDGIEIKNTVSFEQDGKFTEFERVSTLKQSTAQVVSSGEWSFDGTNLKRKYTSLNGQLLTNAKYRYVTYTVRRISENEFIGLDNINLREIRFSKIGSK